MAKDQCAKWFHYIQKPFGKKIKKRSHGSVNGTNTHIQKQTNTCAPDHTHTYSSEVMYDHISEQQKIDYPYHAA